MSGPSDPSGEPSEARGDEPTPPRGTPGPGAVPAWDPGATEGGSSGHGAAGQGPSGQGAPGPQPYAPGPGYGPPPGHGGYGPPPGGYGAPGPGAPGPFGMPHRAPKPGIVPLRPLGLGEILDGALGYIRAHPRIVLGTSAIVAVISQLLQVALQLFLASSTTSLGGSPDLAQLTGLLAGASVTGLVLVAVTLVATAVLTGVLMVVISRSVLGAPVEAGEVWRAARPRVPGVLAVALLVALIGIGILTVALLPGLVLLAVDTALGVGVMVLGFLAGVVVLIWISVSLSLATPAYVLEGVGVREALRRSWFLVSGRFWPVFGIQLLGALIAGVVSLVIGLPFQVLGSALGFASGSADPAGVTLPVLLLSALGGIIAMTLTTPFQSGVTGLLYVDQRMRREGFDIELQRAAAGGR
ncbi:glycerophosphoryl diester phosphodiesterase membrane domain-containing protein [Actinomycetospora cinnamomea]|uniref:Glycerophosphoryl diester phosphodiesterase family protein n=1 Tax=Actinomycetospora cinnamomea TaxID=663609 RepID=A0A2U1FHL9_9PSEU|nr:glycerophosphoryl diester phosphodiesterase membrane domain-containing protein [Actinomycetospora cinnamomea]PVZ11683.1 glycerophosphoryl diester phosphodiesterase family protein [Actinomycetospora cinnamomea]